MPENLRIEELRRRVQSDPASIAFAALAEEYRRAGQHEEAIATCRTGLKRHPAYLSAHVTLGRALIEVGQLQEARDELEYVLKTAPENLAAIRGLAEIHHRLGDAEPEPREQAAELPATPAITAPVRRAIPVEPPVTPVIPAPSPTVIPVEPPATPVIPAPSRTVIPVEPAAAIPLTRPAEPPAIDKPPALDQPMERAEQLAVTFTTPPPPLMRPSPPPDPALAGLEGFLGAILRARRELDEPGGAPGRA